MVVEVVIEEEGSDSCDCRKLKYENAPAFTYAVILSIYGRNKIIFLAASTNESVFQ